MRRALRRRYGHARLRSDFINKVESTLVGAIVEFYKGVLASRLSLGLAAHWAGEASRLVRTQLARELGLPIRGFKDRGQAFMQAVKAVEANDARYRARAEYEVRRDYERKSLGVHVEDYDTRAFWQMVHEAAAEPLQAGRRRK